jgi:hypothetical protein
MGKRLIAILALALIVGLTYGAAYAEVQNVKVSGDIKILGVARNNFTLGNPPVSKTSDSPSDSVDLATKEDDKSRFIATQTRVRVDADLTDNVMATVRLINERIWTGESVSSTDIDLDLAYITLKEFLYSPLTLTFGRQEIRFGNQLIIGNAGTYNTANPGPLNGLPEDLSVRNAFDALRATLNYDPLVIDLVYAKTRNANNATAKNVNASDDTDLFGVNASYDVTKKVNVQGYFWGRLDKSQPVADNEKDEIYTIGGLITIMPIEGLKASLESAWQRGRTRGATGALKEERNAWALQALADYTFTKVKFTPSIGAGYTYLTGGSDKNGWHPMYYNQALNPIAYAIFPFTNLSVINLRASAKPMEDVTLGINYGNYQLANSVASFNTAKADSNGNYYTIVTQSNNKDLGNEIDLSCIYDYTEDVQIGVSAGWFLPGDALRRESRVANQVIGSMKVTF